MRQILAISLLLIMTLTDVTGLADVTGTSVLVADDTPTSIAQMTSMADCHGESTTSVRTMKTECDNTCGLCTGHLCRTLIVEDMSAAIPTRAPSIDASIVDIEWFNADTRMDVPPPKA